MKKTGDVKCLQAERSSIRHSKRQMLSAFSKQISKKSSMMIEIFKQTSKLFNKIQEQTFYSHNSYSRHKFPFNMTSTGYNLSDQIEQPAKQQSLFSDFDNNQANNYQATIISQKRTLQSVQSVYELLHAQTCSPVHKKQIELQEYQKCQKDKKDSYIAYIAYTDKNSDLGANENNYHYEKQRQNEINTSSKLLNKKNQNIQNIQNNYTKMCYKSQILHAKTPSKNKKCQKIKNRIVTSSCTAVGIRYGRQFDKTNQVIKRVAKEEKQRKSLARFASAQYK